MRILSANQPLLAPLPPNSLIYPVPPAPLIVSHLPNDSLPHFLWILSRTPKMTQEDLDFVLTRAKQRGYDTSKLIWVEQK